MSLGSIRVYRVGRKGSGRFSSWTPSLDEAIRHLAIRIEGHGPCRVKEKGEEGWSRELSFPQTKRKVRRLCSTTGPAPDAVWVKRKDGTIIVLDVGVEHLKAPPAPAGVAPSIARVHEAVYIECERLEVQEGRGLRVVTMGYTVCKWIGGRVGGTPSQHCPGPPAPTGGNAMDFVIRNESGRNDIEATDHIVAVLNRDDSASEVVWRNWPDHYPNHVHVSGSPKREGTPWCL